MVLREVLVLQAVYVASRWGNFLCSCLLKAVMVELKWKFFIVAILISYIEERRKIFVNELKIFSIKSL